MVHRDALTEAPITIFFSKKRSVTASSSTVIQKRVNKGTKKSQMEYRYQGIINIRSPLVPSR